MQQELFDGECVLLELVPFRGKNPFEPCPSNKIVVPFRVSC